MSIIAAFPTRFILPDLVSHCDFKLRISRHHKQATTESKRWLFSGDNLSQKKRKAIHGLKAGRLTAMCYPDVGFPQLRVCCDFLTYLFHLDDLSDDMDNAGTKTVADLVLNSLHHPYDYYSPARLNRMSKDLYRRMLPTASSGTCRRFIETMDLFFQAVHLQSIDRAEGIVPGLESYISQRRDTSGCKPCWALIEYANNLDIPDKVMEHPIIQSLGEAANDLVTWSNDIFSYNVEQSKGDTHNMICVVMFEQQLDLQSAVDFVGELCKQSIDRFNEDRKLIPSWGDKIDKDVAVYVRGLADWIVGSLHWSFDTTRYFQNSGREIKKTRVVNLLPPRRKLEHPVIQSLSEVPNDSVIQSTEHSIIQSFGEANDSVTQSMEHPIIQSCGEANGLVTQSADHSMIQSCGEANDSVAQSNDVLSGDVEQSKGDAHTMIPVVMYEQQLDLQSAVNFVGEICKQSIGHFNESRKLIPSWGPRIDSVRGLAGRIVGGLHWSFGSTRYLQNSCREVREKVIMNLPLNKLEHPVIQSRSDSAPRLNDTFSDNIEQEKGDAHDMIPVITREQHLDLCNQSIERFNQNPKFIPSWGPKIDSVRGLAGRIVGNLHWSFGSMRCFYNSGRDVELTRVVNLLSLGM